MLYLKWDTLLAKIHINVWGNLLFLIYFKTGKNVHYGTYITFQFYCSTNETQSHYLQFYECPMNNVLYLYHEYCVYWQRFKTMVKVEMKSDVE